MRNNPRQEAIAKISDYLPEESSYNPLETPVHELFGSKVFNERVMQDRLPKSVYKSVKKTINEGNPLDPDVADIVANAMKDWAIENGATHYSHWFHPLTGLTA